jgi:hypothetical protein
MSEFISSTDQSAASLYFLNPNTRQDIMPDWSTYMYLIILHMIGRLKMNERLPDMTPIEMSL